ncbi:SIR2 family protein [Providencia rettgeri]|uniref:SIR2 family protein n=1 Tax=Providencia rettgeri TaxID=587 RepID=UPI000BDD3A17|nr:hypothetical protein CQA26_08800 [Providencia rettgeri]
MLSVNWRKIYTTNYDDLIEKSLSLIGKTYTVVTCDDIPHQYKDCTDMCFHINGNIINIKESDLESKIKLSQSSYLDSNQFSDTPWYREFKRDVFNAKCIIFVGYSLYDMDIKKLLIENTEYLSEKTFFITRKGSSIIDSFDLIDYGTVLPIGVDGFSEIVDEANAIKETLVNTQHEIRTLNLYQHMDSSSTIIDEREVYSSLLFGVNDNLFFDKIALSIINNEYNGVTKFINRKEINDIVNKIQSGGNVLIVSELANGKTFILKTVRSLLTFNQYQCYNLSGLDGNISLDLDEINKNKKNLIIVDDYHNHVELLRVVLQKSLSNIQFIIASRSYEHEQAKQKLTGLSESKLYSFSVNRLMDSEVSEFDEIISYLGLWKERAGLTLAKKLKEIDYNSRDKLSSLLLHILKSKNVKDKLSIILDDLKRIRVISIHYLVFCCCPFLAIKVLRKV